VRVTLTDIYRSFTCSVLAKQVLNSCHVVAVRCITLINIEFT
jgi:hypothetical protein